MGGTMEQDTHPLKALIAFFLGEYEKRVGLGRFYLEMSQETFGRLLVIQLEKVEFQKKPIFVSVRNLPACINNLKILGNLFWDDLYVPIVQQDKLPKGKAVLRRQKSDF